MDDNASLREDVNIESRLKVQPCTTPTCAVNMPSQARAANGALHFINPLYELHHGPAQSSRDSVAPDGRESPQLDGPLAAGDPAVDNGEQLTAAETRRHVPTVTVDAARANVAAAASLVADEDTPRRSSGHHEDDARPDGGRGGGDVRADVTLAEPARLLLQSAKPNHGRTQSAPLTSLTAHLRNADARRSCSPDKDVHQHCDHVDDASSQASCDFDGAAFVRKLGHSSSVSTLASVSSHTSSGSRFSLFPEFDFSLDGAFTQSIRHIVSKSKIKQNFMKGINAGVNKIGGTFSQHLARKAEGNKVIKKITNLMHGNDSYFGVLMRSNLSHIEKHLNTHDSAVAMLATVRAIMTQLKNYVLQSSELDPILSASMPIHEKDVIVEKAICKCILKSLKGQLDQSIGDYHLRDGSIKQLRCSCEATQNKTLEELGVTAKVPNEDTLAGIRQALASIQQDYLPLRKIKCLLKICKVIYKSMEDGSGRQLGADEFMPVLTYVLVRCDIATLKQDMDYMTELMEPCMIHGEGQYYLISIQGVLYLLEHVETERCSKLFRSGSLGQWQHRVSVRSKASLGHDRHSQVSV
ncbi:ras and Rab interactor 2-like [Lethenteron reissneri]|uniref:ras and Rab interactor 2-like n=1 Tax=Lethenteron reissneri TaxID=7753 RepID=UPI002AB5F9E6|nr:ras and Rab interactor 2-like [Lethenteron reissneri]